MFTRAAHTRPIRTAVVGVVVTTALLVTGCSASSGKASVAATTTAAPATTEPTATTKVTTTTVVTSTSLDYQPDAGQDLPGGQVRMGEKTIMLDGFIGVKVPDSWKVTSTKVPLSSQTDGSETELDTSALERVLAISPTDDPEAATFALIHYAHSDKVPGFEEFATAVRKFAVGKSGTASEAKESRIGGQKATLQQITYASGNNGVLIPFQAGDEYFFILALVSDKSYSDDAAAIITSLSLEPEALHS